MLRTLCLLLLFAAVNGYGAPPERIVIGAEARKGIAIVDPADSNAVLWRYDIAQVHDLHLLDTYHILSQDGWPKLIEITPAKEIAWTYDSATQNREDGAKKIEVHAYQRLANGWTMIAESGASRIIEVDSQGAIQKQFPLAVSSSNAHSDTRLVRKLDNGHYLVAHEADQVVKEYDTEGKVIWEFAIPLFGKEPKKGHGPEAFGGKCFAATRLRNGNTLIATGNGHSVLEVTPDKEIVWKIEQNDLPGITLAWVTNVEERENGNFLIGNCHAGPENPQIIELTRDKEVVWTFRDFETFGDSLANTLVLDGDKAREVRKRFSSQ